MEGFAVFDAAPTRRKLKSDGLDEVKMVGGDNLVYLTLLLRLAVLTHHSRSKQEDIQFQLVAKDSHHWQITIHPDSDAASLLVSDLQDEIDIWQRWGMQLDVIVV